jgi:hypothetical protein
LRRLIAAIALVTIVAIAPACRTRKKAKARVAEEDGQLVSVVAVADPTAAIQLVRGFHALENDAWRWTMKNFTVTLRPPAGSDQSGAKLELKFVIPEVIFSQTGPLTVDAHLNNTDLGSENYSKAGDYTYTRDIPASALHGDTASFDFTVDKGIPPSEKDSRELAIIVSSIGLTSK